MAEFGNRAWAENARREVIYYPDKRPGYVAWVTAFEYGNGNIGFSFKETIRQQRQRFQPPTIEEAEAAVVPVSYCSVMCGSEDQESFRIFMISKDDGRTFEETGRCLESEACLCNVGFPDGRILGFESPSLATGALKFTGGIAVRESLDGGNTWREINRILEGESVNLWRARRLRDGTTILLCALASSPWGPDKPRATRNTRLPDEEKGGRYNPFFLTTADGLHFTGPHHILAGTDASRYDMVERPDGSLLFINGDAQGALAARQIVHRNGAFWVPGSVLPIHRGAPKDPIGNSQGGFVPETVVMLDSGAIVGARHDRPYSCSVDEGANWFEIDGLPDSLYQPFMLSTRHGLVNFGHYGGDISFGQADMYIGADRFCLREQVPRSCTLSLRRCLSDDGSHFQNRYAAQLLCGGEPLGNQQIVFRFAESWNANGSPSNAPQEDAPYQITTFTNADGWAEAAAPQYENAGDIHFSYIVDAVFQPRESCYLPCVSPRMSVYSLRPHRHCRRPYNAYFVQGDLYVAPEFEAEFPQITERLSPFAGMPDGRVPVQAIGRDLAWALVNNHVAFFDGDDIRWKKSVHAPAPLVSVKPMGDGDWYD